MQMPRLELAGIQHVIQASNRVLEIGGGSGFQASLLSELAEEVVSIDVNPHPDPVAAVTLYDGKNIPYPDAHFGVIFSSNALEHIEDIGGILAETHRILKNDGIAVHILPTVAWRIATTLSHYPGLPRLLWGNYQYLKAANAKSLEASPARPRAQARAPKGNRIEPVRSHFKIKWIGSILWSPRHGERGNVLTEAWYYRRTWWRRQFDANGWTVIEEAPLKIFYTGNMVLGSFLPVSWRQVFSRVFGSSTRYFVLAKNRIIEPRGRTARLTRAIAGRRNSSRCRYRQSSACRKWRACRRPSLRRRSGRWGRPARSASSRGRWRSP
jgi:SAM-dependent methyltransferase